MPSRGAVGVDQALGSAKTDHPLASAPSMRYQHSAPGLEASTLALGDRSLNSRNYTVSSPPAMPSGLPSSSPRVGGRQRLQPTPVDLDCLPNWPSRGKLGGLAEDDDAHSISSDGTGFRSATPAGQTAAPRNNLLSKLKKKKEGEGRGLLSRIKGRGRPSATGFEASPSLPADPFGRSRRDEGDSSGVLRLAAAPSASSPRPAPRNPWENLSTLFSDVDVPLRAGCATEHAPARWSDFVHLYRHGAIDVSDPPPLPLQAPDILEATWVIEMPPGLQELARTTAAQRLLEPSSASLTSSSASQLRIVSPGAGSTAPSIASDLSAAASSTSPMANLTPILQSFPSAPRWGAVGGDPSRASNLRDRRRPSAAPSHASSVALEPARCSSEWGADEVLDPEGVVGEADAVPSLLMLKDGMGAPAPPFEAARLLALHRCRYERFLTGADDPMTPPLPSALGALAGVGGQPLSPSIAASPSISSSRQRANNVTFGGSNASRARVASSALSSSSRGRDSATSGGVSSIAAAAAAAASGAQGLEEELGARDTVATVSLTFAEATQKAVTSVLQTFVKSSDADHEHVARLCFVGKDVVVPITAARQAKNKVSIIDASEGINRLQSLEAHVILNRGEPAIVFDARIDPRFADLSNSKMHSAAWLDTVAFFASTPVRSPEGYPVATLSFASSAPRMPSQWSTSDTRKLKALAHNIEAALESVLESDAELKAKALNKSLTALQRLLATTATPTSTLVDSLRKVSGAVSSSATGARPQPAFASSLLDEVQQTTMAEEETLKQDEERATYQQKLESIEAALRIACTELDFDAAYIAELSSGGTQMELLASFGLDSAALEGDVELESRAHIDAALDTRPRVFQNVSVGAHKGKHIGHAALPWWYTVVDTSSPFQGEPEMLPAFTSGVMTACNRAVPDVGDRTQHVLSILSRDETKVIEAVDVTFVERVAGLLSQALPSSTLSRLRERSTTRETREHVESWARTTSTLARPPSSSHNKSSRSAAHHDSYESVTMSARSISSQGHSLRQQNSAHLLGSVRGPDADARPGSSGSQRNRTRSSSGNSPKHGTAAHMGRPTEPHGRPRTATNVSAASGTSWSGASDALRTPASCVSDLDSGVAWSSSSLGRSPPSISTDSGSSRRAKLREPVTPPEVPAMPSQLTAPESQSSLQKHSFGQTQVKPISLDTDDEDAEDGRRPYTDDDFVILSASGPAATGPLLLPAEGQRVRRPIDADLVDTLSAPAFIDPFAAARGQQQGRTLRNKHSTTTIMAPRRDSSLKTVSRSATRRAADVAETKAIAAAISANAA